jgi:ATP-dependent helicase Lhr and Lhr-like helicase
MTSGAESRAFERLHPKVQRWIWEQNWTELREAQEAAVDPILDGNRDVIIASATASGKTEAAFLPIGSRLASETSGQGLALYISPLKALINDQFSRLEPFFEHLDLPAYPWHGDIVASKKKEFTNDSRGVLLITPESLEGLFVLRGIWIHSMFANLRYSVVDEVHSFIGTERGRQLQSLLARLETAIRRPVPRVGLSATLGDMGLAAEFLRPGAAQSVCTIVSETAGQEIRLLIQGYEETDRPRAERKEDNNETEVDNATRTIGDNVFKQLRGSTSLVFANSRANVEIYADMLRERCESERLPNEFWPHHGSLSKNLRENAEAALKNKSIPATAVCTSTLELGIDIGAVESVAQIGPPYSVTSLRQRLGRSGRRGEPAVLRVHIKQPKITITTSMTDELRVELVQTVAIVRLLLKRWCEPPNPEGLHLSTLIHQVLSLIAQRGGVTASQAWHELCQEGAFHGVQPEMFARLLKGLGGENLILQSSDGTLLHAPLGEKIVNHYSFFTVFVTPEEYRVIAGATHLGTLPVDRPLQENSFIIFGGRRWRIVSVDEKRRIIEVIRASGGRVPGFSGLGGCIHDRVRREMFAVYQETAIPKYLDPTAALLLSEGRDNFHRYRLNERFLVESGTDTMFFLWAGDRIADTIAVQLRARRFPVMNEGIVLHVCGVRPDELRQCLKELVAEGPADPVVLSRAIANKLREKYDQFLPEELLCEDYGKSQLDTEGAWRTLSHILGPGDRKQA